MAVTVPGLVRPAGHAAGDPCPRRQVPAVRGAFREVLREPAFLDAHPRRRADPVEPRHALQLRQPVLARPGLQRVPDRCLLGDSGRLRDRVFPGVRAARARLAPLRLLRLGGACAPIVRWLCFPLEPGFVGYLALQGLHAFSFGAVYLANQHAIARVVPDEVIASAQGVLAMVMGLLMALVDARLRPALCAFRRRRLRADGHPAGGAGGCWSSSTVHADTGGAQAVYLANGIRETATMKQNKYDDPEFFGRYSAMARSTGGLSTRRASGRCSAPCCRRSPARGCWTSAAASAGTAAICARRGRAVRRRRRPLRADARPRTSS